MYRGVIVRGGVSYCHTLFTGCTTENKYYELYDHRLLSEREHKCPLIYSIIYSLFNVIINNFSFTIFLNLIYI